MEFEILFWYVTGPIQLLKKMIATALQLEQYWISFAGNCVQGDFD